jgi:hypothetical protein
MKEISGNYADGRPHIYVSRIREELNTSTEEIQAFLKVLYSIGFISYYKDCKDVVSLTETGKNGEIPLHRDRGDDYTTRL